MLHGFKPWFSHPSPHPKSDNWFCMRGYSFGLPSDDIINRRGACVRVSRGDDIEHCWTGIYRLVGVRLILIGFLRGAPPGEIVLGTVEQNQCHEMLDTARDVLRNLGYKISDEEYHTPP